MTRTIQELVEPGEVAAAWPVMRQLRPHLDETQFLSQVTAQRAEGYRLVIVRIRKPATAHARSPASGSSPCWRPGATCTPATSSPTRRTAAAAAAPCWPRAAAP